MVPQLGCIHLTANDAERNESNKRALEKFDPIALLHYFHSGSNSFHTQPVLHCAKVHGRRIMEWKPHCTPNILPRNTAGLFLIVGFTTTEVQIVAVYKSVFELVVKRNSFRADSYKSTLIMLHVPLVILKRLGERMAGQRKRRKMEAEIKWSLRSSLPADFNASRQCAKHSRSSLEKQKAGI